VNAESEHDRAFFQAGTAGSRPGDVQHCRVPLNSRSLEVSSTGRTVTVTAARTQAGSAARPGISLADSGATPQHGFQVKLRLGDMKRSESASGRSSAAEVPTGHSPGLAGPGRGDHPGPKAIVQQCQCAAVGCGPGPAQQL
jgi:hypothetical protein